MKKYLYILTICLSFFIVWCSNTNKNIQEINETELEFLIHKIPSFNYAFLEKNISKEDIKEWRKERNNMYSIKWNKVYYYEFEIKWVDIDSFMPLLGGYSIDKNNIYIWNRKAEIDVNKFNFVSWTINYLTDWENIYWWDKKIEWADKESFIGMWFENPINNIWYAKDKNNYYLRWEILTWTELEEYFEKK